MGSSLNVLRESVRIESHDRHLKKFLVALHIKARGLYLIIALFILWEIAPRVGWVNPHFLPPFSQIIVAAGQLTIYQIILDTAVSLKRILIGFSAAILIAVPLGFIMAGALPKVPKFLNSLMMFLAQIPPFILFPVFVVVFGVGEGGIYTVILWSAVWPILFTTMVGVGQVDPLLIKCARSMGADTIDIFFKVVIPEAFPSIMTGLRSGMTMCFMMLIGAETLGADSGLGWLISNAQKMGLVPRIYLAALLVAVVGLMINYLFEWLENEIIIWKEQAPEL